ncbi:conserved Plasmodium protein, unknown function [Plasmodium relictum]|uniref:Uncharacterized protein n=1 Tax=Plasmodium relictum TaxID=85471 RepID=A0A1J1HD02_PLARL|nr:conserved Plasmodium protein, unknown function [Plasmodium relictum]CRH02832.1 conserved Plasmodium protein, unknown function [Plasmodium relictum]
MDKKLKRGISLIRKFAEKYKNAILQTLKLKSRKTIEKKKLKRKKTFKTIEKNSNKKYIEEKKRKLDIYLINQEKELDFQENYAFFNKFHDKSDNIFYKNEIDNIQDPLKVKTEEKKNEEQTFNSINDNFLNSLNSLHFKIKQEIEENNDLLSMKELTKSNKYTEVESKEKNVVNLKKISHANKDLKTIFKEEKNFNERQLVDSSKKIKKRKKDSAHIQNSNCEKKINNSSSTELNENYESIYLKKKDLKILENKDETENKKTISNYNISQKKIIDDIIHKNNEIVTEKKKNDLVFGKNKFENINEIFQKVLEESEYDKNNINEIIKHNNQENSENNIINNEYSKENVNICDNILNKIDGTRVNEYFKDKIIFLENKIISEENDKNCNDNEYNLNYVEKGRSKDNQADINFACDQNNSEEIKKYYNILTPLKEDNSFDFFFNESLGTPSIFQM